MQDAQMRDLEEILGTAAGRRFVGYIFDHFGLWNVYPTNEFQQGKRSAAVMLANSVRELDPRLIGDCDLAYKEMVKQYDGYEGKEDDDGGDE